MFDELFLFWNERLLVGSISNWVIDLIRNMTEQERAKITYESHDLYARRVSVKNSVRTVPVFTLCYIYNLLYIIIYNYSIIHYPFIVEEKTLTEIKCRCFRIKSAFGAYKIELCIIIFLLLLLGLTMDKLSSLCMYIQDNVRL